jgi:hypothetical protein
MKTKSGITWLLVAAVVGSAAGAARAQEQTEQLPAAAADEDALVRQMAALEPAVCAADPQLCADFRAFASAAAPCLPDAAQLTVGHAYLVDDEARVQPAEYFVLRSYRAGDVTLVQTQHVFSENAEEKQAAEALVAGIQRGVLDQANPLYVYVDKNSERVPQLLAQPEGRSLVVRAEGPLIFLRQAGAKLYAVLPETVVTRPDGAERKAGLLFSVLPAPTRCE